MPADRLPFVEVDALDPRAELDELAQDEAIDGSGVLGALLEVHVRGVNPLDDAARLRKPDLAGDGVEQRPRRDVSKDSRRSSC